MTNLAAPSLLTYYAETTAGVPPANAAAWISDGIRLRHIGDSLDVSGVERVQIEDMRNQLRVKGNERRVEGLDNPEFPFAVYGHGVGEATAAGDQVADSAPGYELASLLGHAIGSVSRGYSNTITGGTSTTTVLAVTDASDHTVGDFVAVQFATPPTGYAATTAWPRRIIARDIVSTPNTITVDQVLPATPAAADIIHGCIAIYHDEDVLADSSAASGRTRSWLVQKGLPGAGASVRESWVFRGCVAQLQQFAMERGGLMQFAFNVMAASHEDPTTADWPTAWSSNAELGLAPLSISPITEVWMVTDGVTTNTRVGVSRFEVEPGIPRVRTETLTSNSVGMMGTAGYATQPADTVLTMTLDPFGIAQWTDQLAGTEKTIRWARLGPAGSGFAVHFPRMSHMVTPKRAINNATTANEVQFLAHEEEGLGTSNLQRSAMVLVMW
jgi:hypothetical protein